MTMALRQQFRLTGSWLALVTLMLLFLAPGVDANDRLTLHKVTDSVYAIVGDLGDRSAENLGNNATFGLVITSEGAVLIDSGGTRAGAAAIHAVVQQVTDQPIVKVINTGGQDHRWMGNDYFRRLGAEIIASAAAVSDQQARAEDQIGRLTSLVGKRPVEETIPVYADRQFSKALSFTLGDIEFVLQHTGGAHTPGDIFIWLPGQSVMFTGDIVYIDRMLGVIEVSSSKNWIETFNTMAQFKPQTIVPGHGPPTGLEQASRDTLTYLTTLREGVADFIDAGNDIADIGKMDHSAFSYLRNFDQLAGRNAQQVFTEMEWE